jgi:transposase-like protein
MAQHFLLTAKARTLSLAAVMRLSDSEAFQVFKECRREGGVPVCPKCGVIGAAYEYTARRIFKCKACCAQFSVTSGTIFAGRKLAIRDYLGAIALFVNGAKGVSMLQVSRDLNVQYKTAFVLCHKLREAMASKQLTWTLQGEVEIDGAYFGGTIRQENKVSERVDRRLKRHQTGARRAVVVMRERRGRTLPVVVKHESDAIEFVADRIAPGSKVYADEGTAWDALHAKFDTRRINHSVAFSDEGVCTNQAESYFARLRRSELGVHHHFSPQYLHQYAGEMAWREDHRRVSNGEQYACVTKLALAHPVSRNWKGYWQRAD